MNSNDPRLAAILGSPERTIEPRVVLPEILDEVIPENFLTEVESKVTK
jgi:hypothetical protein